MKAEVYTRENITKLVNRFYIKILGDDLVGPFFVAKLGDDMRNEYWKPHLNLLVNFWSSIVLNDGSYRDNPFMPHTQLGELNADIFSRWLELFFETLDEIYEPQVAIQLKERSDIIAANFMRNLGIG